MRILVTGASGFIGSHVSANLKMNGHVVVGLDIRESSENQIDIRDYLKLKSLFKKHKFDCVIHLAAKAGVLGSMIDPEVYMDTNQGGFYNVISLSQSYGVKQFIFASSSSVYGDNNNFIAKSVYAKTKANNEEVGRRFSKSMRVIGLRFFTVYGPNGRREMSIYKWTNKSINNFPIEIYDQKNEVKRFYTYIDDVVHGIHSIILRGKAKGFDVYDIAGPEAVSIRHAAKIIQLKTNSTAKIITKENLDYDVSYCEPERRIPHLVPTPFITGISEFIKWAQLGGMKID
jgi:UDP-glucuronate 4-epimerase